MDILHLNWGPGPAGFVLRLQTRLHDSTSSILKERYQHWQEVGLAELGMTVATRIALIYRASYRLMELLKRLRDEIEGSGQLNDLLDNGYVYTTKDERIFYDICVSVDSFYFEFRSCYEVLGNFMKTFCMKILDRKINEVELIKVLDNKNIDIKWIDQIRENRKLLFHENAPWIALDIEKRTPLVCSLLIMKENLQNDNDEIYITQYDLKNAADGMQKSIFALFDWLTAQVDEFEKQNT